MSKKTARGSKETADIRSHLVLSEKKKLLRSRSVSPTGELLSKMDTSKLTEEIFAKLSEKIDTKFNESTQLSDTSLGDRIDEEFKEMTTNMNTNLDEHTNK